MGGKAAKAESAALPSDEAQGDELSESEAAASSGNAEKAAEAADKAAESGSKAEAATAEKSDGGLPYTVKDGRVAIASKARAGKKIIAKTGEIIEFDKDGKASVRAEDAAYLSAIAGFEFE